MFFEENKVDEQAEEWCQRLYSALSESRKGRMKKSDKKAWTQQFILLRKKEGPAKVEKVLSWYIQHIGEEFIPQAFSGTAFKSKFCQIEQAMERSDDAPEIDERWHCKAERLLLDYNYPIEVASSLPAILHKTSVNWTKFLLTLVNETRKDPHSREYNFVSHIGTMYGQSFIEDWMVLLSRKYGKMEHYNGPVMSLVFTPSSKLFRESFWHKWSSEWCGGYSTFDSFLDKILEKE
jgi:hypothetical protein